MKGGKTRKVSKRIKKLQDDSSTAIGKNPALEAFWDDLAAQKKVVVIYKDKTHKFLSVPKKTSKTYTTFFNALDEVPEIVAVLSSNASWDAYEIFLYPKAKDKTVEYVIEHYKKFFKPLGSKDFMRKVMVPG